MPKAIRKWHKIGKYQQSFILYNRNEEYVEGVIELITDDEEEHSFLTHNQDSLMFKLAASTEHASKVFNYDPHNPDDARRVTIEAMQWVEDMLPLPVHYHSWPVFLLKSLLFWKYHAIWKGWKLVALIPKDLKNRLDNEFMNEL